MKLLFICIISILISCSSSKQVTKTENKPLLEEGSGKVVTAKNTLEAQTKYKAELFGFKLGQYKEAVREKFGEPYQTQTFDDGFEADIFVIDRDVPHYTIFKYPSWNKEIIYSIQVFGPKK